MFLLMFQLIRLGVGAARLHAAGTSEVAGEHGGDGDCGYGCRNNNGGGGTATAAAVGQMVVAVMVLRSWLGLLAEAVGCCTIRI